MKITKVDRDSFFRTVKSKINFADIVGDIGCGIRPQNFIEPKHHICIDPHKQYLDHIKEEEKNHNRFSFINTDWNGVASLFPESSLETIFLLDVIEHLEKDVAFDLLNKTKKLVTNQIVIFTPLGFIEQNHEDGKDAWGLDGGKWQEHKSGWMPEDFGEDWEFIVCENFHTHDNLGEVYETPKGAFFAIFNSKNEVTRLNPFFSVVVPTYNHADYLAEALDSLLAQSFPLWEAVVVNDGSTDNTLKVLEEYSKKDSRIKYFDKENGGVSSALNVGLQKAQGKWICWLSSDDFFEKIKLEVHFNAIIESPQIKFHISMWSLYFNEAKRKQEAKLWAPIPIDTFRVLHLFHANYIHGNSIAVERSVIQHVGFFDEKLLQGQDFDYWLRILFHYSFSFLPVRTCTTRLHEGQTTNQFFDGGVFDSTYSLIKNCAHVSFSALFPKGYLNNYKNARTCILEAISITLISNAFIHKLGYSSFLIDKIIEWFKKECPNSFRTKLIRDVKHFIKTEVKEDKPAELMVIINKLTKDKYEVCTYDFVGNIITEIQKMIDNGEQKKAMSFERFLMRSNSLKHIVWEGKEDYKPILFEYWDASEPKKLDLQNIVDWKVNPKPDDINKLDHQLTINCSVCNNEYKVLEHVKHSVEPNNIVGMCPNCKTKVEISEKEFINYINLRTSKVKQAISNNVNVAFFVKQTSVVGGGTKIVFKHINWLNSLGVEVTLFSYDKKPAWVELKANFQQINEIFEIDFYNYNQIIAFSIFDIPEFLKFCSKDKVTLFCQGYEGYHFGEDHVLMREDKYMLTQLHSLPFNTIGVSTHLIMLFKRLFNKDVKYIPNGIDLTVFGQAGEPLYKRKNSITFIGNPFHMLKGFKFLFNTLFGIQRSKHAIKNLELNVVLGFQVRDLDWWVEQLESIGLKVNIYVKLKQQEVSQLLKETRLLAVTSIYEGFSLPILEAMASGTPVISTKNLGAESFCVDCRNSYLVDYGNFEQFAEKIFAVFYNEVQVKHLVQNALSTVRDYSEYNSAKAFVKIYSEVLGVRFNEEKVKIFLNKFSNSHLRFEELHGLQKTAANKQYSGITSLILVTFNQINYTLECIQSVKDYTKVDYEIIVVDNNSSDNTVEKLSKYPDIKLIQNKENLGFPNAVNIGIRAAAGKHILILNNDTVVTKGWLDRLIDVADSDEKIGIAGPISNIVSGVQVDKNAKYQSIEEMYKYAEKVSKENKGQVQQFPRVAFLCTLIKREVIDKIGGLDERFSPGNFEDDDFCLRAQLAGYKTVIVKDVFIHHYGSKSFKANGEAAYAERMKINQQKFVDKWGADPNEIWLKGEKIKSRNIVCPVNNDEFIEAFNRTLIHSEDNEFELALKEIERAITTYNESNRKGFEQISKEDLLNLAGNISLQLGHFEKSKEFFELELVENPNSGKACLGLAETFYKAELFEEAKTMYEWAIKNGENKNEIWNKLNSINQQLGLQENHNSLELSRENEIHSIQQAEELICKSDLLNAEKILLQILNSNPNNIDALNDYAVVHIMQNNFQPALEKINKVIQLDPSNEVALDNLKYIEQEVNSIN